MTKATSQSILSFFFASFGSHGPARKVGERKGFNLIYAESFRIHVGNPIRETFETGLATLESIIHLDKEAPPVKVLTINCSSIHTIQSKLFRTQSAMNNLLWNRTGPPIASPLSTVPETSPPSFLGPSPS